MLGILTKRFSLSLSLSLPPILCSLLYWLQSIFLCVSLCNLCYFVHKVDGLPRLFDIPQDMAESQNEAKAYFIFPNDSAQNVSKEPEKRKRKNRKLKQGKAHIKCEIYVRLSFVFTQIVHRLYRIMTSACLSIDAGQCFRPEREEERESEWGEWLNLIAVLTSLGK